MLKTNQQTSHMVSLRVDGRFGYTSNIRSNSISEVKIAAGEPWTLAVGDQPEGAGARPDGQAAIASLTAP